MIPPIAVGPPSPKKRVGRIDRGVTLRCISNKMAHYAFANPPYALHLR